MSLSYLPLQDMIASVVKTASDRLSAQRNSTSDKIKHAASSEHEEELKEECEHGMEKTECMKCAEVKTASFTNRTYIMKLASACDFISENVENIAPPNRGILGSALAKIAEDGLPADHGVAVPPTNPEGALHVTTPPDGEQEYKHDKPAGDDAAKSQAGTAETKANMPGGTTQISNNMGSSPGGGGQVPNATYPPAGPFHSGEKTAGKLGGMKGGKGNAAKPVGKAPPMIGGVGASQHKGKKKTAGELARELILSKLAGEDVMKANISASGDGGPLVGEGELKALISDDVPSNPTDGSGYGNDQRRLIDSNQAAIDYTKADAKKPQGKQMSEVLDEPAFSPEHDSKLREQLRNAGEAGVKIAGAAAVSFLKQAAAKGALTQETVEAFKVKTKTASDLTATATTQGSSASKDAAVAKLRTAMDAQRKHKASMGDMGGGDGGVY